MTCCFLFLPVLRRKATQKDRTWFRMGFHDGTAPAKTTSDGFYFSRVQAFERNGDEPSIAAVLGQGAIQGTYKDIKFKRSNSDQSSTVPTGNSPSGWYDEIPSGTAPVWQVIGTKDFGGNLIGTWSNPERIVGLTYRGNWASGTTYLLHDMVAYSERSFICTSAHTASTSNKPPTSNSSNANWDLMAGKGDQGDAPTAYNQTIAITGTGPVNLRTLADNHTTAYDGVGDATITYTVASGVTISGTAGASNSGDAGHAVNTGTWPAGATINLTLQVTGTVRGGGGGGGKGGTGFSRNGQVGGDGGDAIYCQEDLTVTVNSGGKVQAGGGGGGGGAGAQHPSAEPAPYMGGGGGGGFPNGIGGTGYATVSSGTGSGGGAGASGANPYGGDGGSGGGANINGGLGYNSTGDQTGTGGSGGTKGYAIRKNGHTVSVTNNGTITGTQA